MAWNNVWDSVFEQNEWGKYPDESMIRFVARNFYKKERSQVKILEVGCGPGANIWYLAREGFNTFGIDGSKVAIERCSLRLQQENLTATLKLGDVLKLPFADCFFDGVVDNECIAHNPHKDADLIVQEIKRVLAPGGLFYSRTFSDRCYSGRQKKELAPLEYDHISDGPFAGKGFIRLTNRQSIESIYKKHLALVSVDTVEFTFQNQAVLVSEWVIVAKKES